MSERVVPDYRYSGMVDRPQDKYCIFGLPPQWDNTVDPTLDLSNRSIGRAYNNIVLENLMPVIVRVGTPTFMGEWFVGRNEDKQKAVLSMLNAANDPNGDGDIQAIAKLLESQNGEIGTRYYDFKEAFEEYSAIVSRMIKFIAIEMERLDSRIGEFTNFNLSSYLNKNLAGYSGEESPITDKYLSFYADSGTSYSDGFSNSTTESMLAGLLKKGSQLGREMQFIIGNSAGGANNIFSDIVSGFNSFIGADGKSLESADMGFMKAAGGTILSGGNILFPEIWEDSTMSKSYNLSIKLFSANGSPYSIFKNIYIPMLAIMGLALPRYINEIGYCSPFILKLYSKGYFNCDLGMITSLDIKRSDWSIYKLPLQVEINIGIKDLYPVMILASNPNDKKLDNNVSMYEYLRCISGQGLIQYVGMGRLAHMLNELASFFTTTSELSASIKDIINNAKMYLFDRVK